MFEAVNTVYLSPVCNFCLVLVLLEKVTAFLRDKMSHRELWGIDLSVAFQLDSTGGWNLLQTSLGGSVGTDAATQAPRLGAAFTVVAGSTSRVLSGQNHAQK